MSPLSKLISVSTLALSVALAGSAWGASDSAQPKPPAKPAALKDSKSSAAKPATSAKSSKDAKSGKEAKSGKDSKSGKEAKAGAPTPPAKPKPGQAASAPLPPRGKSTASGDLPRRGSAVASAYAAPTPRSAPPAMSASSSINQGDLRTLVNAVNAANAGRGTEALSQASSMSDPVARKLVTWLVIRNAPNDLGFDNINTFLQEEPGWPTQSTLRRRAERVMLAEQTRPEKVFAFFNERPPLSGEGKIALARALAAQGKTSDAADWVRDAWREDELSERTESLVLGEFGVVLTRADHMARAARFSYKPDSERALRAASRAGSDVVALTRARLALARKDSDGPRLLAAVPGNLSGEPAYLFAKAQMLRRADKPQEAAQYLLRGPKSQSEAGDSDEWWIERRLVSRELLDAGDAATAYRVAATGATPAADNYRAEQQFTAGWIALRFLHDPRKAAEHFAKVDDKQDNPIALARAAYWQARAAEAMGNGSQAQQLYRSASRFSTTYYGQLARVKLGLPPVDLRGVRPSAESRANFARLEPAKAIRMLYAINEPTIAMTMYYDLAWRLEDSGQLALLYELAEANDDARGALVVGKESVAMGHPLDREAFPTFGIPSYSPIGDSVDKAAVYAITRQESQFNARTLSSAQAMGLMQVTPDAAQQVAKITGATYNRQRLMSDQSYNVQFGAAELGELVRIYDGNYAMSFAAYNAGRGSVRKWIDRYGDPRDPSVDVVDWVELIPYSETRNYVQRVMENYQVYKVLFNVPSKLQMEADLRGSR